MATTKIARDDSWITVKPNGPQHKGSHVMLGEGGEVKTGMGGKFNGRKMSEVGRRNKGASSSTAARSGGESGGAVNAKTIKPSDAEKARISKKTADGRSINIDYNDGKFTATVDGKRIPLDISGLKTVEEMRRIDPKTADRLEKMGAAGIVGGAVSVSKAEADIIRSAQNAKQSRIENNIPGIKEVRDASIKIETERRTSRSRIEQGMTSGNLSSSPARTAVEEMENLRRKYPKAVAYEQWKNATGSSNTSIAKLRAARALEEGATLAEAKKIADSGSGAFDSMAFDRQSMRTFDENGFLHVKMSPITKETVNEYYGAEIPGWQELGLDARKIYRGYRPAAELERAAQTFNGLNILSEHVLDDAKDPPRGSIVGSMGTDAKFVKPKLYNSLIIKDAEAIALLNPSDRDATPKRQISASYRYDPVFKSGEFNGQQYDFIMTNIRGNHIALVEDGRAGPDVVVADENTINKRGFTMADGLKLLEDVVDMLKAKGVRPHEGGEEEARRFMEEEGVLEDQDIEIREEDRIAEDDRVGDALTRLFALIDSSEDQALADELRDIAEMIRPTEEESTEEIIEDEDMVVKKEAMVEKERRPAMDRRSIKRQTRKDGKGNVYNINVPAANDAQIVKKVETAMRRKMEAATTCRPLIGDVDALAFDSAASIYRKALEVSGHKTDVTDVKALQAMVKMACEQQSRDYTYPSISSALAQDSKRNLDPAFAHLGSIRKAF